MSPRTDSHGTGIPENSPCSKSSWSEVDIVSVAVTRENNRIAVLFAGQSTIPSLSLLVQSPKQSAKNICHHWFDVASVYMYVKYVCIYIHTHIIHMCICVHVCVFKAMWCYAMPYALGGTTCVSWRRHLYLKAWASLSWLQKNKLEEQNVCKII